MLGYLLGFGRAIFRHGFVWWLSLLITWVLGIGIFGTEEYAIVRGSIANWLGFSVIPERFPLWLFVFLFVLWVCGRLAHVEAMRYWQAARVFFSTPYVVSSPLYDHVLIDNVKYTRGVRHHFYMAKIDVGNRPYKANDGRDIIEAWIEIEVFDLDSAPIANWRYPRWEENEQPGYEGNPSDRYPDKERVRSLAANGRPHIVCIAYKPVQDVFAYPLRGEDQLRDGWIAGDIKIPAGSYLLRVRISGKGLEDVVEKVLLLENRGRNGSLELSETNKRISHRWP